MAKDRADFKSHVMVYIGVNLMLIAINFVTSPHTLWFYWPLVFWGLGLLIHGIFVYLLPAKGFEQRLAEKEYEKLKAKKK